MKDKNRLILTTLFAVILAAIFLYVTQVYFERKTRRQEEKPIERYLDKKDSRLDAKSYEFVTQRLEASWKKLNETQKDLTDSDLFSLYFSIGSDQRALGLLKEAEQTFVKALALQKLSAPEYASLWYEISRTNIERKNYYVAESAVRKSIELFPANREYWGWLALIQEDYLNSEIELIKKTYEEGLKNTMQDPILAEDFAGYLERVGLVELAKDVRKAINPSGGIDKLRQNFEFR